MVALLAEFESFTPAAWYAALNASRDAALAAALNAALAAALNAARAAARSAARDASRDAAWTAARAAAWTAARDAVLATLVRDVITPEQYERLMAPVEAARAVMRETDSTTPARSDQ